MASREPSDTVTTRMLTGRRTQALTKIDAHIATLNKDTAAAQGDAGRRAACLKPLEALKDRLQKKQSLAHITQCEGEAVKEFDLAVERIEQNRQKGVSSGQEVQVIKKQRVVRPSEFVRAEYFETSEDVNRFLDALRQKLEQAIASNEIVRIR
jgi:hypothetical protein